MMPSSGGGVVLPPKHATVFTLWWMTGHDGAGKTGSTLVEWFVIDEMLLYTCLTAFHSHKQMCSDLDKGKRNSFI